MLMKTKNIPKKSPQKLCSKIQNKSRCKGQGSNNQNLKRIYSIGSEIIDATDGQMTDGRRTMDEFQIDEIC